jgi:hypothetical protein
VLWCIHTASYSILDSTATEYDDPVVDEHDGQQFLQQNHEASLRLYTPSLIGYYRYGGGLVRGIEGPLCNGDNAKALYLTGTRDF